MLPASRKCGIPAPRTGYEARFSALVRFGVVCLLSALAFHQLTTQSPHEVWLAIDVKARKPSTDWPPLRIVRFSGAARAFGVESHVIEGVEVRITSRAKTVADCFKHRNKIGIDVALTGRLELDAALRAGIFLAKPCRHIRPGSLGQA